MKTKQNGFSVIELLLIIVLLTTVVLAGVYIQHRRNTLPKQTGNRNGLTSFRDYKFRYILPAGWSTKESTAVAADFGLEFDSPNIVSVPVMCEDNIGGRCTSGKASAAVLTIQNFNATGYANYNSGGYSWQQFFSGIKQNMALDNKQIGHQSTYCDLYSTLTGKPIPADLPQFVPDKLYKGGQCDIIWGDQFYNFTLSINDPKDNKGLYELFSSFQFVQ